MKRQVLTLVVGIALFGGRSVWGVGPQYTVTDLGILPGGSFSDAWGINASGQIVGSWETNDGNQNPHAFLYSNGTMTDLGTLPGYMQGSQAFGINDAGQVVGVAYPAAWEPTAFLYSNGTMTSLGTLPGGSYSEAYAINAAAKWSAGLTQATATASSTPFFTATAP